MESIGLHTGVDGVYRVTDGWMEHTGLQTGVDGVSVDRGGWRILYKCYR